LAAGDADGDAATDALAVGVDCGDPAAVPDASDPPAVQVVKPSNTASSPAPTAALRRQYTAAGSGPTVIFIRPRP
jgi:hypothetical protein